MKFSEIKSETLNLRVSPTFKLALKKAADNEQRSMVNMLEVLLGDYCDRKGIGFADLDAVSSSSEREPAIQRASAGETA